MIGAAGAEANPEPSAVMVVIALLVVGFAVYGVISALRKPAKFLGALAKSNADAKAAARAQAAGGDARALSAVDVGGVHVHTSEGRRSGNDDDYGVHDDERGGKYVIDRGSVFHVDPAGNVRALDGPATLDVGPGQRDTDVSRGVVDAVARPRTVGGDAPRRLTAWERPADDVG